MTLIFENESGHTLPFDEEEAAVKVMEAASDYVNCPFEIQVNLILTDNEGIRRLNREFREIDKDTDVLSFPSIEYSSPGRFTGLEQRDEYFDLESGELLLGDMMISVHRVYTQAEEYGHSLLREFSFLIAHSMLHLFGYDHMDEEESLQMESMQEQILNGLGITRD